MVDGTNATTDTGYNIAIGYKAKATDSLAVAIGKGSEASGLNAYAIGTEAKAINDSTFVLGGATVPLSVGIGTDAPNSFASLELADTNKGFLVNRLTTSQKTTLEGNLTTAENGMLVYDTDLKGLYVWDGTQWASTLADNLGSHIASENVQTTNNWISNDGDDEGIYVDIDGKVGIGLNNPSRDLHVYGDGYGRFENTTNGRYVSINPGSATLDMYNGPFHINRFSDTDIILSLGGGKVGIGNNAVPIHQLDVTGTGRFTDALTIGNYTLPILDGTVNQVLSTDGIGGVTWRDATVNTDEQELSLINNVLSITNDATSVDLSGYLDNTDAQDLSLSNHVLYLTNDTTPINLTPYVNTDTQLTETQVDAFVSNNGYLTTFTEVDGDITNEIQDINLTGTNLSISSGSTVDLSSITADLEIRVTALENAIQASGTDTTPQKFNYQAVVNDNTGEPIANTSVSYQISILQGSSVGTSVYTETHSAITSAKGLTNLVIGEGTLVSGDFSTIDWGTNVYYLEIEVDVTGGTSYIKLGTSQLVSVPYALHAQSANSIEGMSTVLLKRELENKDQKIKALESKVNRLEKMMERILQQGN